MAVAGIYMSLRALQSYDVPTVTQLQHQSTAASFKKSGNRTAAHCVHRILSSYFLLLDKPAAKRISSTVS